VFKLASPNIRPWLADAERDPASYAEKLTLYDDPLAPGWKAEHVLWEIALREGFGLKSRFDKKALANGNTVYEVTDPDKEPAQTFAVCLDDEVRADLRKHYDLPADRHFVCRDRALVKQEVDAFGDAGPLLYLVRETKSTTAPEELRGTEKQKVHCGERHFRGALGVDYKVVTNADDLL
jgi:hypothetical protein